MTVVAPISMPPVARATRWEVIRLSSIMSTRMTLARSGIWSVMPSSFSTAEAVGGLVEHRREVVHAGAERHALRPGAELHVLLDAGVQVADARAGLGHRLAVELEDEAEHAVRRRVLRPHVDDDALLVEGGGLVDELVPVAAGGVEDVGALGGRRRRRRRWRRCRRRRVGARWVSVWAHQLYDLRWSGGGMVAPLYSTGMPPRG